jgi:hypothetical protein
MEAPLIRVAIPSEQKELEQLQLRSSLGNAGGRDALLANPEAIELGVAQIAQGRVFVSEYRGEVVGFAAVNLEWTVTVNWMAFLLSHECSVAELGRPYWTTALTSPARGVLSICTWWAIRRRRTSTSPLVLRCLE